MRPNMVRFFLLGSLAATAPLSASEPDDDTQPADLVANARRYYGISDPEGDCAANAATEGAIVVCGKRRPPPRIAPVTSPERRDGKMAALGSSGIGHGGGGVTMRICFLQKCPKKLYFFDIAALPEPAPGTEADKIAHGLAR